MQDHELDQSRREIDRLKESSIPWRREVPLFATWVLLIAGVASGCALLHDALKRPWRDSTWPWDTPEWENAMKTGEFLPTCPRPKRMPVLSPTVEEVPVYRPSAVICAKEHAPVGFDYELQFEWYWYFLPILLLFYASMTGVFDPDVAPAQKLGIHSPVITVAVVVACLYFGISLLLLPVLLFLGVLAARARIDMHRRKLRR